MQFICGILFHNISIHALCEEGDPQGCSVLRTEVISIHALCEEGDPAATPSSTGRYDFYPRPLRGGRLSSQMFPWDPFSFLSTPSARRATLDVLDVLHPDAISIHALCEEGDLRRLCGQGREACISIHALCEEGDVDRAVVLRALAEFLSTPSARRATATASTKSYWGQRFLSTPSARRATTYKHVRAAATIISIHALCEEGDLTWPTEAGETVNFYPRPLRGGRP